MLQVFRDDVTRLPPHCAPGPEYTNAGRDGCRQMWPHSFSVASVLCTTQQKVHLGRALLGENNPISVAKIAREGWTPPLCFLFKAQPCFAFHTFGSAPPPSMGRTFPILQTFYSGKHPVPIALPRITALGPSPPSSFHPSWRPSPTQGTQLTSTFPAQSGNLGSLGTSH